MSVPNSDETYSPYQQPYLYSSGGFYSWVNATNVLVNPGQWRDSTDSFDIILPSAVTVNLASVGVVNGVDTINTPSPFTNSPVYLYVIADSRGFNPTGGLFCYSGGGGSTGFIPKLPMGYDMLRRIGSVMTNSTFTGAGNIRNFALSGSSSYRIVNYMDIPTQFVAGNATTPTVAYNVIDTQFPNVADSIWVALGIVGGSTGDKACLCSSQDTLANTTESPYFVTLVSNASTASYNSFRFYANFVNYQLQYFVSNSSDTAFIYFGGYSDSV